MAETFGATLKRLREGKPMSQQALADSAGLHRVQIAKLEAGDRAPLWETVRKLAKALGVKCHEFEGDDEEPGEPEEPKRSRGRPAKEPPAEEPKKPKGKGKGKGKK